MLLLCPPGVVLPCDPQASNQQQQRPVAVQRCSANPVPSLRFRTTVPLAHIRVRGLGFNGIFRFFHPKIAFFFFSQGTRGEEKMSEKGRQRRRTPTDCAAWMRFVTVLLFFFFIVVVAFFLFFFAQKLASTGMLASRGERGREKALCVWLSVSIFWISICCFFTEIRQYPSG